MAGLVLKFFVAYMAPAILGFLSFRLILNTVSDAQYGLYSSFNSLCFVFIGAVFGWLRFGVTRYQPGRTFSALRPAISRGLAASIMLAVAIVAVASAVSNDASPLYLAALLYAVAFASFDIFQERLKAHHFTTRFMTAAVGRSALALLLFFVLVWPTTTAAELLIILAASFAAAATSHLIFKPESAAADSDPVGIRQIMRYSLLVSVMSSVTLLRPAALKVLLIHIGGAAAAAPFAASFDLAGQIGGVFGAVMYSVTSPPAFAAWKNGDTQATSRHLSAGLTLYLTLALPCLCAVYLLGHEIFGLIFAQPYAGFMGQFFALFLLSRIISNICDFYISLSFQLSERTHLQVGMNLFMVAISLLLVFAAAQWFGPGGAIYGLLLSDMLTLLLGVALTRRSYRLPAIDRNVLHVAAACVAMSLVIVAVSASLSGRGIVMIVAASLAAGLVYAVSLYAFDVLGARQSIKRLLLRA